MIKLITILQKNFTHHTFLNEKLLYLIRITGYKKLHPVDKERVLNRVEEITGNKFFGYQQKLRIDNSSIKGFTVDMLVREDMFVDYCSEYLSDLREGIDGILYAIPFKTIEELEEKIPKEEKNLEELILVQYAFQSKSDANSYRVDVVNLAEGAERLMQTGDIYNPPHSKGELSF